MDRLSQQALAQSDQGDERDQQQRHEQLQELLLSFVPELIGRQAPLTVIKAYMDIVALIFFEISDAATLNSPTQEHNRYRRYMQQTYRLVMLLLDELRRLSRRLSGF